MPDKVDHYHFEIFEKTQRDKSLYSHTFDEITQEHRRPAIADNLMMKKTVFIKCLDKHSKNTSVTIECL